ncbi:MAG TPA: VOC family protein [Chloroflexota bacterium]|jgi:catechol 2,3-dioxygenase-like lactoylglutathione lyase family enzyme
MSAIRGLVEVVLVVDDIDKSVAFYRDTLGFELFSPAQLPAKFLRIGPLTGGVPQQIVLVPRTTDDRPSGAPVLHHIGLEVAPEQFEPERERLTGLGFELRTGQHPFMPVEAFYLDDPDGNEIEIATWRG